MTDSAVNLDNLKSAWEEQYRAKRKLKAANNPQFQLLQGNKLLAQHKLPEAIACYRRALKLDPNSIQAHRQLASALKQQGKLAEANVNYRRAIDSRRRIEPPQGDRHRHRAIARIYLDRAASFASGKEWQKSITACQEALDFNPQLAEAYKLWGDNLTNMDELPEAMGYYAKALAIKPDFAEVYLNLGSISCQQQQWQSAIEHFQRAIAIEPQLVEAYRNLARIYKKLGRQRLMLDYWFKALQIEPAGVEGSEHCKLARIMVDLGDINRAIACYVQALKLQPQSATVYLRLGELLARQNTAEAIKIYQRGLKYFPRHGEINLQLARLIEEQNTAGAIAHYRQAIATQPKNWQAAFGLGNAFAGENKYAAALDCYRQVNQLNPDFVPAYLKLAEVQIEIEQWLEVVSTCQRGLKLDPKQERFYDYLGFALLRLQKYDAAIEVYTCWLKLNPAATEGYRRLGRALMAGQKWTAAVSCYRQLLKQEPCLTSYRQLGEAAAKAGEWQTCATAWAKAIELQPEEPWSYHHLGIALMNLKRWAESATALERSLVLNPNFAWTYFHLGDVLAKQQRWQESSRAYRSFLAREKNCYAYERLGNNLVEQMQAQTNLDPALQQEAEECYYRALEIEPDYLQPYYKLMELRPYDAEICLMLAETYARQEEWSTAIIFYQIGLGIAPNLPQRHFELAMVLERQRQFAEAIAHYRLAIQLAPDEFQYQSSLQSAMTQQKMQELGC